METMNTNSILANEMMNIKGATIVRLATATTPKMRKRGNPLVGHEVIKVVVQSCQFGYSYENAVNNRLGGGDSFKSEALPWGHWAVVGDKVAYNKIIEYNGNLYGRFYTIPNPNMEIAFFVDGRFATEEEVAMILSFSEKRTESTKQSEAGLTEHQVQPMCYNLESIISLKGGIEYHCESLEKAYAVR